jgi:protein O-GlcNAc transferase
VIRDHDGDDGGADLSGIPALVQAGRGDEAERRLRRRLDAAPDDVDALHFLGLLCHQSGRIAEAVGLIGRAVTLAPGVAFIQANFGETLRLQGDLDRAERHAHEAVRLAPEHPEFRINLANILAARRRHAGVIEAIDPVLAAQPERIEVLSLKADACFELDRIDEALELAERAYRLEPGHMAMLAKLMRLRAWACDWRTRAVDLAALIALLEQAIARADDMALRGFNPFITYEYPAPQALRNALTDRYASQIIKAAGAPLAPVPRSTRADRRRLRLGYVSADFHSHPTMHLMAGFFALHERARFEVFAYSIGPDDGSDYRRLAVASVDHFIDIGAETGRQSAERMRRDGIDILVDLKGFTHEARPEIFALRPAPIRVAWLGYAASTGSGLNDYAIVDRITVPPANLAQFSEKLVWMPHSYQVNDHRQPVAVVVPTRQSLGLPETGFVYACFNHVHKIEPAVFASWMRILSRVPGSVLWLYRSNASARGNLLREAETLGIAPARIVFGDTLDKPRHLARLGCADLFLDTGTYNAHTSASDALWAGVPVLTRPGEAFPARVGASLVTAAGLPQMACGSVREYEDAAVRLANDRAELEALRNVLKARERLPLFDTPRFVRDLERAFEVMWERYMDGKPPESFAVEDRDELILAAKPVL